MHILKPIEKEKKKGQKEGRRRRDKALESANAKQNTELVFIVVWGQRHLCVSPFF